MPPTNDLHVDKILTNLSVKYRNERFLADMILPPVRVRKRSDKFFRYKKDNSFRIIDSAVGPKAQPNEVDWDLETDNYSVTDYALADYIPVENINNADTPLEPRVDTVEFLNELLAVDREKRVADLVFSADTYPASNKKTLAGTAKWGGSTDKPIEDVLEAVEGCFMRANVLVFGQEAWQKFRALPEVQRAVKVTAPNQVVSAGLVTAPEAASFFEVEKILVGRARYNSAKRGQGAAYARIWGKAMAALYVHPHPGLKTVAFGVSFMEMAKQTQTMLDPKRGAKGAEYIKVAYNSDEKIIASDLGYLLSGVV